MRFSFSAELIIEDTGWTITSKLQSEPGLAFFADIGSVQTTVMCNCRRTRQMLTNPSESDLIAPTFQRTDASEKTVEKWVKGRLGSLTIRASRTCSKVAEHGALLTAQVNRHPCRPRDFSISLIAHHQVFLKQEKLRVAEACTHHGGRTFSAVLERDCSERQGAQNTLLVR